MREMAPTQLAALRCPACAAGPLEFAGGELTCGNCAKSFPLFGNIPCLMPDPPFARAQWAGQLESYTAIIEGRLNSLRAEADLPGLLPMTRERVQSFSAALREQDSSVEALFAGIKEGVILLPGLIGPGGPEAGAPLTIVEFYENVFRDWMWGEKEAGLTCALVARAVTEPLGTLAVYGAGAGRLAVDIHQMLKPSQTFALDINPLPLLIADKLIHGETLELPEFPISPHTAEQAAIMQSVRCPFPVRENFTFVLADAFHPPFAPGTLDAILTPWFIDSTEVDFRGTAAAINRALRPGGVWINMGPLRFRGALSQAYTIEEVYAIVARSGFDVLARESADLPYFDSPHSGHKRIETVFCFSARKTGEVERVTAPSLVPAWVQDNRAAVPFTAALGELRNKSIFAAGVISLVDGKRSVRDIAKILADKSGMGAMPIENQLKAFFAKLPPG